MIARQAEPRRRCGLFAALCLLCISIPSALTRPTPRRILLSLSFGETGNAITAEALFQELFEADYTDNEQMHRFVNETAHAPGRLLHPAAVEAAQLFLLSATDTRGLVTCLLRVHLLLVEQLSQPGVTPVSLPGLRRVVAGAIIWQRQQRGVAAWSGAEQTLVDHICADLVALHTASAQRKAAIEFLHVSKSGGSSMCLAAQQNGCSTQEFAQRGLWGNCKMEAFNDQPRWVSPAGHAEAGPLPPGITPWWMRHGEPRLTQQDDCAMRSAAMRAGNYSYYNNEYTTHTTRTPRGLEAAGVCADFMNVALLRNPARRMKSHLRSIIMMYKLTPNGSRWIENKDAAYWRRLAPAAMDNFYIRSLLGQPVFLLPVGALTPAHADAARRLLLEHYDVLLVLEQVTASKLMLQLGLGWRAYQMPRRNDHGAPSRFMLRLMPADFEDLVLSNALDADVYRWGRMLQRLDTFVFAAASARRTPPAKVAPAQAAQGNGLGAVGGGPAAAGAGGGGRRRATSVARCLHALLMQSDGSAAGQESRCGFVGRGQLDVR